ncbi:MAG: hypothetical protein COZ06_35415 [Armatimonadetes bacterium CG_4_10_14_3_um_filter_66_18]|nr:diguanylate cyclase [Armatimonadota bacterium]OIO93424.1 MAG: hypothetical protein AUJ96_30260 [Armatimonadetes bacterium CG2_30_66_41]PIU88078.1 MAG: hypothetical protein COS65_31470 [Armatimonadetes bacterium CG06_land_8_20_14_3_00_66_21]PIX44946.1 MAG: hypothetical protein COZ57_16595 [Armatimonadetes bacterium CG_4_8_14_3_um_filter_66_20]PIY36638.1 MAG: hypothetical protein COZ06_35415 [Armatimonadetes bacterium CG_4_10_14_3_um_filter_66_18]PIZ49014.1 MAG: hypothetical protein COY42_049
MNPLKTGNWRIVVSLFLLQAVVFAVGYFKGEVDTATLYCATILLGALYGGYALGIQSAATATTLFIYTTVSGHGLAPALFWLKYGVDVVFMLALGAVVGRLTDDQRAVTKRSLHDALTGLYNRGHLNEQLHAEIDRSQRHGHPLSVLMIDIDHFKSFNDRHGHQRGDAVLRQVAHVLRTRSRSSDVPCRYGGEEFSVILTETPLTGCQVVGDRLRTEIANSTLYSPGIAEKVTISIGAAQLTSDMKDAEALLKAADQALYQAKQQGRDRVVLAQQTPSESVAPEGKSGEGT